MKGGGCVFARDSSAAWGCPSGAWLKVLPPSSVQLVGVQARALFAVGAVAVGRGAVAVAISRIAAVLPLPLKRLFVPLLSEVAQQDTSLVHHDQLLWMLILGGQVDGGTLLRRSNSMFVAQMGKVARIVYGQTLDKVSYWHSAFGLLQSTKSVNTWYYHVFAVF